MVTVPVRIELSRLFCYHGADESTSEPYLWTIAFTLDGRTITHRAGAPTLDGGPDFIFSPGSHGSLGGGVGIGETRPIPSAAGRVATSLQPVRLSAGGDTYEVPGRIGLIAVLLEENATSDAGAEAAHRAINDLVSTELTEAVADINIVGLAAEINDAMTRNPGLSAADAARRIFAARVDRVVDRISRVARSVAIDAIVRKLRFPGVLVEGADPDAFMGLVTHFFDQDELSATDHTRRIEFTDTIAQPGMPLEASEFVYNLHGAAWQPVEEYFTPVTDQVPAGRWQVTGVARSGRAGKQFISHIGGQLPDGAPWLLAKGPVMDAIVAGSHTFFVRGESGGEAHVVIDRNDDNPYFPFLTTTPDNDPTNNLGRLPPCPLSIRHTRPVPD